jgi:hypothetical protein
MMSIPRLWQLGPLVLAVALVGGCGGLDDRPSSDDAESSAQEDSSQAQQPVDDEASQSSAQALAQAARAQADRAETVAAEARQRAESLAHQASDLMTQAEAAASVAKRAAAAHTQALQAADDMEQAAVAAEAEAITAMDIATRRHSAEKLLNTLMQQIKAGEYEPAGQKLGQLDEMKQSLPASTVTQIDAARKLLNALQSIKPEADSS